MSSHATALDSSRTDRSSFFVWTALACVFVAFGGFAPTFWLQLPAGTLVASPLLVLHGLLFSAWPIYLVLQTTLVARGRVTRHRSWGLLGVSLATAMVMIGFAVANDVLSSRLAAGYGDRARAFHIASISMVTLFGVFVAAAIAFVNRPEIHKRLMLLATASMLPPAISRIFFTASVGFGPGLRPGLGPPRTVEAVLAPSLIADALIVAGMIYDVRKRGRPHTVYIVGGAIVLAVQFLRGPLSETQWWYDAANFMARFSG